MEVALLYHYLDQCLKHLRQILNKPDIPDLSGTTSREYMKTLNVQNKTMRVISNVCYVGKMSPSLEEVVNHL